MAGRTTAEWARRLAGGLGAIAGLAFVGFAWSFRTRYAPVQDAVRRLNRAVMNPRQLRTAGRPGAWASVVVHVGRTSGRRYRTPVVAVPTDPSAAAFVITLPYGPGADWVRNVLAAGSATVVHEGRDVPVVRPELITSDEVRRRFPDLATESRFAEWLFGLVDHLVLYADDPPAR